MTPARSTALRTRRRESSIGGPPSGAGKEGTSASKILEERGGVVEPLLLGTAPRPEPVDQYPPAVGPRGGAIAPLHRDGHRKSLRLVNAGRDAPVPDAPRRAASRPTGR